MVDVALLVELLPLVVEAVGDLMPDHDADAAVVQTLGEVAAVEEGLENPRGKHDIIFVWTVESIDNSRCCGPSVFINWSSQLGKILLGFHV